MNKTVRNLLILVSVTILIFAIIFVVYQKFSTKPVDSDEIGQLVQNNTNIEEKEETNDILLNEEEETTNVIEDENQNKEESTEDKTPNEEKAIKIAKETWKQNKGSIDEVTFGNVTVQADGKYVVCVSDNITTASICFYIVDLKTGMVEER